MSIYRYYIVIYNVENCLKKKVLFIKQNTYIIEIGRDKNTIVRIKFVQKKNENNIVSIFTTKYFKL